MLFGSLTARLSSVSPSRASRKRRTQGRSSSAVNSFDSKTAQVKSQHQHHFQPSFGFEVNVISNSFLKVAERKVAGKQAALSSPVKDHSLQRAKYLLTLMIADHQEPRILS